MIDEVIIISQDNDPVLKTYFEECKSYTSKFFDAISVKYELISGNSCNTASLDLKLEKVNSNNHKVLLIVFTHGLEDGFVYNNTPFLTSTNKYIKGHYVYSNACLAGKNFGVNLSQQQGVFIGYSNIVQIPINDELVKKAFIECECYGLYCLYKKKSSLSDLINSVECKFNFYIDELRKKKCDSFNIIFLMDARDNFVVLANNLQQSLIQA